MMALVPFMLSAMTPAEALQKAKDKISSAKSLSADFTMNAGGRTTTGKLLTKGTKFSLTSNLSSSWYDGSSLYVYNPASAETTVMKPSAAELAEANPLSYISSSSLYNVTGSKQKTPGMETVVLIPKKSGSNVKSIMIQLNASTFLPAGITVTQSSGSKITISLSNIRLNPSLSDSQFVYPKAKYGKAKLIDLR